MLLVSLTEYQYLSQHCSLILNNFSWTSNAWTWLLLLQKLCTESKSNLNERRIYIFIALRTLKVYFNIPVDTSRTQHSCKFHKEILTSLLFRTQYILHTRMCEYSSIYSLDMHTERLKLACSLVPGASPHRMPIRLCIFYKNWGYLVSL